MMKYALIKVFAAVIGFGLMGVYLGYQAGWITFDGPGSAHSPAAGVQPDDAVQGTSAPASQAEVVGRGGEHETPTESVMPDPVVLPGSKSRPMVMPGSKSDFMLNKSWAPGEALPAPVLPGSTSMILNMPPAQPQRTAEQRRRDLLMHSSKSAIIFDATEPEPTPSGDGDGTDKQAVPPTPSDDGGATADPAVLPEAAP